MGYVWAPKEGTAAPLDHSSATALSVSINNDMPVTIVVGVLHSRRFEERGPRLQLELRRFLPHKPEGSTCGASAVVEASEKVLRSPNRLKKRVDDGSIALGSGQIVRREN